jgi:hypothetical protein
MRMTVARAKVNVALRIPRDERFISVLPCR